MDSKFAPEQASLEPSTTLDSTVASYGLGHEPPKSNQNNGRGSGDLTDGERLRAIAASALVRHGTVPVTSHHGRCPDPGVVGDSAVLPIFACVVKTTFPCVCCLCGVVSVWCCVVLCGVVCCVGAALRGRGSCHR